MTLNFLPASVRAIIYAVTVIASLVLTAVSAGYIAISGDTGSLPDWLRFANAALVPLAGAAGLTALANVTPDEAIVVKGADVADPALRASLENAGE